MLPLIGGGESSGCDVRETDNGGGLLLQGVPEGTVPLQGVRGGDDDGIYGKSHDE